MGKNGGERVQNEIMEIYIGNKGLENESGDIG